MDFVILHLQKRRIDVFVTTIRNFVKTEMETKRFNFHTVKVHIVIERRNEIARDIVALLGKGIQGRRCIELGGVVVYEHLHLLTFIIHIIIGEEIDVQF